MKIRIGIMGYGNIGKGVELAITENSDMNLVGIFTRRDPNTIKTKIEETKVYNIDEVDKMHDKIDVMILCGGSATDLPKQGPFFATRFNTVDSYDNHDMLIEYRSSMSKAALSGGNTSIISTGWDPGIFSYERVLANSFIKGSKVYGFYGLGEKGGLSMGHSDALRRIEGVVDARQYTHAITESIERVKNGENPELSRREMHWRECFVVLSNGTNKDKIKDKIITMPGYFEPYETKVNFIDQAELDEIISDRGMCHDGLVIASGKTAGGSNCLTEYRCQWDSNPEATANILITYARACYRLNKEGNNGVKFPMDVPVSYLTQLNTEELIKAHMI